MRHAWALLLILLVTLLVATGARAGILDPVTAQIAARERAIETERRGPMSPRLLELLLDQGRADEAASLLPALKRTTPPVEARAAREIAVRVHLARKDYVAAAPFIAAIRAEPAATAGERELIYKWLFLRDDAAEIDRRTRDVHLGAGSTAEVPELLAAGRLAYDLMAYARAESCYAQAATAALAASHVDRRPRHHAAATAGLGVVAYKKLDDDRSLELLTASLAEHATPDALTLLSETLGHLGRTGEAIDALTAAIQLDPLHETAHYYLGNGASRRNYTELVAAYPTAFADSTAGSTDLAALIAADSLAARGRRAEARDAYAQLAARHPERADLQVRLASLSFESGNLAAAHAHAARALAICPEYGRAHAVLAKALEAARFAIDVHRPDYEARFAAAESLEVPAIATFVTNWPALTPRHQKRAALSLAPWQSYIPLLAATNATCFVKPLALRLSESPHLETLRDQRIGYDSRLWDDVRGCGGYHMVTGIEDVERSIFDRYDTLLHELSHQVHAVLTPDQSREIEALYRQAKLRDEKAKQPGNETVQDGFLSRYAAGSVYEYFAEGANALGSPRRDAYDRREVVRERLLEIDPDLARLVERLQARNGAELEANYAVAYVQAGHESLTRGDAPGALARYRSALIRLSGEESALNALVYGLTVSGQAQAAVAAADSARHLHPASGELLVTTADAAWHAGRGLEQVRAQLEAGRSRVRVEDLPLVDRSRGGYAWVAGEAPAALAAYDSALAREPENPDALWGRAAALALAERWDEAFAQYEAAVKLRTGLVPLRTDFARDLWRAGRLDAARAQLAEAALLEARDPVAEALRGLIAVETGAFESAGVHLEQALAWGPWCDLAHLGRGRLALARGAGAEAAAEATAPVRERLARAAPPEYIYRPEQSAWRSVHELPAVERALLVPMP
jgi:tetratricopeptide (TPR) repeat protein